jgi:hypothetical protein
VLAENVDTGTATNHLVLLNNKLKDTATAASDGVLKNLCESCDAVARELLGGLDKVKVEDKKRNGKV